MRILSELTTRYIDNYRFAQLTSPFIYESDLLKKWNLKYRVTIPAGFVQDFESMLFIRGRNVRGGLTHDYFSAFDSDPIVTKWQAADLYSEMNKYTDSIDHGRNCMTKVYDLIRRWTKAFVVRIAPFYFHRRSVFATSKELIGLDGDPYVTIEEKIEEIITKTEQVSEDIKASPDAQAPAIAVKIDQVTEDMKDVKQEVSEKIEERKEEKVII